MHEIGLIQDLLADALARATQQGAQRIERVIVRVGTDSGIVPEVLGFVFDLLKRDTPAAQANIEIEHVPVVCWCPVCEEEFQPDDPLHICPQCYLPGAAVRRGREFALVGARGILAMETETRAAPLTDSVHTILRNAGHLPAARLSDQTLDR